jgi:hypothetical protein
VFCAMTGASPKPANMAAANKEAVNNFDFIGFPYW